MDEKQVQAPKQREVWMFETLEPFCLTVRVEETHTFWEVEDLVEWARGFAARPDAKINISITALALDENGKKLGPVPLDEMQAPGGSPEEIVAHFEGVEPGNFFDSLADPETKEKLRAALKHQREAEMNGGTPQP